MSIVTTEQLSDIEKMLIKGDKTEIARRAKLDRAIVTQVIKYKHTHSRDAASVYLAAKQLIEERSSENK